MILAAKSFMPIFDRQNNNANHSISNSNNNSRDPLTSISLWLLGRNIISPEQYDLFRQGTSLILVGVLSMSQVRAFFRVVGALGRRLSKTFGMSLGRMTMCIPTSSNKSTGGQQRSIGSHGNNIALLLSSFIMGCYFLACVTVVKMTLPIEYRSSFSTAVGLNFNFNRQLLDMIFLRVGVRVGGHACCFVRDTEEQFGTVSDGISIEYFGIALFSAGMRELEWEYQCAVYV